MPPYRLVLDWDGTVTETDSLHMVLLEFGDHGVYDRVERELGRSLTLHEVIAAEFETVTAPLDEVVAWCVEHVRVRPGFHELVAAHLPLILSSGFHELIEPILEREGVEAEALANRLDPRPDGWRARFRDEAACATCSEACKRASLPPGPIAYAGDGASDHCAALAADRVFARDGLARWLERRGAPFEPFADLHDVARALAADRVAGS
ncbi:MAG TPA: haloacid dehalogenase-like hydrolase [Gaiellaceae bacterium]|nr:haloacid dehalogenase-like hydrolase [Gaiellaceae bacterium]